MELHTSFNTLDYIVLGTILLSGLLAILTGFVREMYSLFNWAASYFIAVRLSFLVYPLVGRYVSNHTTIVDGSIFVVFCISFIILGLLGMLVSKIVQGNALTAIDRSLGFVFGLIRGLLIVCMIYLVAVVILWPDLDKVPTASTKLPEDISDTNDGKKHDTRKIIDTSAPQWLLNAKTRPLLAYGSHLLKEFVPEKQLEATATQYLDKKDALEKKIEGAPQGVSIKDAVDHDDQTAIEK